VTANMSVRSPLSDLLLSAMVLVTPLRDCGATERHIARNRLGPTGARVSNATVTLTDPSGIPQTAVFSAPGMGTEEPLSFQIALLTARIVLLAVFAHHFEIGYSDIANFSRFLLLVLLGFALLLLSRFGS
jgi:hypothetical protein